MRRVSRFRRPTGLISHQYNTRASSPYRCLACKLQTTSFSTSSAQLASKVPYTETIRRRIWGTDKPPGQKDPYGDTSVLDRSRKDAARQAPKVENEEPDQLLEATEIEQTPTRDISDSGRYKIVEIKAEDQLGEFKFLRGDPVWKPEKNYEGFLPKHVVKNHERIAAALRRALVESFALQQAGLPLHSISSQSTNANEDWTKDVQITPSPGGATIHISEDTSIEDVIESIQSQVEESGEAEPTESQQDLGADKPGVYPLQDEVLATTVAPPFVPPRLNEADEWEEDVDSDRTKEETEMSTLDNSSWDPSWLQISLQSPEIKFAVLKRTMQLTGIRLSDATIQSTKTAKALLYGLITPPKPRTLVKALEQKGDLYELGNVTIHEKRRTLLEKETALGRLKVIQKELQARGLAPLVK